MKVSEELGGHDALLVRVMSSCGVRRRDRTGKGCTFSLAQKQTLLLSSAHEGAIDTRPVVFPTTELHALERTRCQGDESEWAPSAVASDGGDRRDAAASDGGREGDGCTRGGASSNWTLDAPPPSAAEVRPAQAISSAAEKLDCASIL